ncbi:MAG: hypothetical protein AB4426_30885 [Xenococcaceae cyanobacterium]
MSDRFIYRPWDPSGVVRRETSPECAFVSAPTTVGHMSVRAIAADVLSFIICFLNLKKLYKLDIILSLE